jgi:hypothetical protein
VPKISHICACLPLVCIGFAAQAQVPFAANQDWRGSFVCPNGNIAAHLHVDSVDKKSDGGDGHVLVRGLFTFGGSEKMPAVAHQVSGDYSSGKPQIKFTPGKWVVYPAAPIPPAGFSGTVSEGGDVFTGQMAYGKCDGLTLKRGASAAKL